MNDRIKFLVENHRRLEALRHDFALKHGFAFTRTQNYKNCVVIRWKASRKKYEINYKRIEEYTALCAEISDKYKLWEEQDPFLESELRLAKIGIYVLYEWDYRTWAIPNENKEIQEYVLGKIPSWAKVVHK